MPTIARLAGCIGCTVLAVSLLAFAGRGCAHSNWLNHDPERQAALDEYWLGHAQFDAGEYLAAIPHYDAWRQLLRRRGEDDSEVAGSIAGCLWRAGNIDEALRVFDESLTRNLRWNVAIDKALCLATLDDTSALAWLQSQPLPLEDHLDAIAAFHRSRGDFAAAVPPLDALMIRLRAEHVFDSADEVVDVESLSPAECPERLADLCDPLADLAECHFHLGDFELAERSARRGIAVGRRLRESAGFYPQAEVEAGDVSCRLWASRVAMTRRAWDEAATHIELARALADYSNYSVDRQAVASAATELARRRAAR